MYVFVASCYRNIFVMCKKNFITHFNSFNRLRPHFSFLIVCFCILLISPSYADTVVGSDADDSLYGTDSDDTMQGGLGNDRLQARGGNDTYIFNRGDGFDTIIEGGGNDKILFGSEITSDHLKFRIDSSLSLHIDIYLADGSGFVDSIKLSKAMSVGSRVVETIEFNDGSYLDWQTIEEYALTITGTDGADEITSQSLDEKIYGLDGNDVIRSRDGNDFIDGGRGDDMLYGYYGNHTIIGGEGNDHLEIYRSLNSSSARNYDNVLIGGLGADTEGSPQS